MSKPADETDSQISEADGSLSDDALDGAVGGSTSVRIDGSAPTFSKAPRVNPGPPNVAKTPAPGGPIPIPYPNTSDD